jgi:hypothetical protein
VLHLNQDLGAPRIQLSDAQQQAGLYSEEREIAPGTTYRADTEPAQYPPLSTSALIMQLAEAARARGECRRAEVAAGSAMPVDLWQRRQAHLALSASSSSAGAPSDLVYVHAPRTPASWSSHSQPRASVVERTPRPLAKRASTVEHEPPTLSAPLRANSETPCTSRPTSAVTLAYAEMWDSGV